MGYIMIIVGFVIIFVLIASLINTTPIEEE